MGEEAHTLAPGSDWPTWEAVRQQAYMWLRRFGAGWQLADLEDMAQEVVLKVIKARQAEAVDVSRFIAWLPTVVKHVAIDYHRARHGRDGERVEVTWLDDYDRQDTRRTAELTQVCATLDVHPVLPVLTLTERTVVICTYWYGLRSDEIAAILAVPANTVRTWHARALAKLRQHLQDKA